MIMEDPDDRLLSELHHFKTSSHLTPANLTHLNHILQSSLHSSTISTTDNEQLTTNINEVFSTLMIKCMEPDVLQKEDNATLASLFQAVTLLLVLKYKLLHEHEAILSATHFYNSIVNVALRACSFWEHEQNVAHTRYCLSLAEEFHSKLIETKEQQAPKTKTEIQGQHFLILSHQIQLQDTFDKAFQTFREAKFIARSERETQYLSYLTYNIAVKSYKKKYYQEGVMWLRQSFELGREVNLSQETQINVLELLADCYLKWCRDEHWAKASHALELAYNINHQSQFLVKRIQAALFSNQTDMIRNVMWGTPSLFSLKEQELEEIASNLLDVDQPKLADDFVNKLTSRNAKWLPLKLKVQLHIKSFRDAQSTCEQLLNKRDYFQDQEIMNVCLNLLQRPELFMKDDLAQAIKWAHLCLRMVKSSNVCSEHVKGLSVSLQKLLCMLYLEVERDKQAREVMRELIKEDQSLTTLAINLKVALQLGERNEILRTINSLGPHCDAEDRECDLKVGDSDACKLLGYACTLAVQQKMGFVARASLKKLLNICVDPLLKVQCLQALLQDSCQQQDQSKDAEPSAEMEDYLQQAYDELNSLKRAMVKLNDAAVWFMKLCWNLAQRRGTGERMYPLLQRGCHFLSLADHQREPSLHVRRKTCLMMTIACGLQTLRTLQGSDKDKTLGEVLGDIRDCSRHLDEEEHKQRGQGSCKDPTRKLLTLYEFEAVCSQRSISALEAIYEKALSQPDIDVKYLEILISLAQESGPWCAKIIIRLIKVAIVKHLACTSPDMNRIAKNYCIMTQVTLETEDLTNLDPYNCITESLESLLVREDCKLPDLELAWLVVRFWNCGVQMLNSGKKDQGEKWCTLSQRLLGQSSIVNETFQTTIEHHLSVLFYSSSSTQQRETLKDVVVGME